MKQTGNELSYLILGSGGTGGTLGAYMAHVGKDVTFIARGEHLSRMQEQGLILQRPHDIFTLKYIKATDTDHYEGHPDVIFVCVKGYSVADIIPFIDHISKPETVVIPILNIFGTGEKMQKQLPGQLVTDGCIYVAAQIKEPGCIVMKGDILRVIFGVRSQKDFRPVLRQIEQDLRDSDVLGVLSDNIRRDAMLKFSYVSSQGACGLYYNVPAGDIQKDGEIRDCFVQLIKEIELLSNAMGIYFEEDIVQRNLHILDDLDPSMTTSLQRDIASGKNSEIDGLIYSVVRLGKEYRISMPMYEKIAKKLEIEI